MDPIIFVYFFTIEGYNVFMTIETFCHVIIMEDSLSMGPSDNDFGDVHFTQFMKSLTLGGLLSFVLFYCWNILLLGCFFLLWDFLFVLTCLLLQMFWVFVGPNLSEEH